jgi:hypothetical protein
MSRKSKKEESEDEESSKSSDDSFDDEDEVPLSKLIPQVKKDLSKTTSSTKTNTVSKKSSEPSKKKAPQKKKEKKKKEVGRPKTKDAKDTANDSKTSATAENVKARFGSNEKANVTKDNSNESKKVDKTEESPVLASQRESEKETPVPKEKEKVEAVETVDTQGGKSLEKEDDPKPTSTPEKFQPESKDAEVKVPVTSESENNNVAGRLSASDPAVPDPSAVTAKPITPTPNDGKEVFDVVLVEISTSKKAATDTTDITTPDDEEAFTAAGVSAADKSLKTTPNEKTDVPVSEVESSTVPKPVKPSLEKREKESSDVDMTEAASEESTTTTNPTLEDKKVESSYIDTTETTSKYSTGGAKLSLASDIELAPITSKDSTNVPKTPLEDEKVDSNNVDVTENTSNDSPDAAKASLEDNKQDSSDADTTKTIFKAFAASTTTPLQDNKEDPNDVHMTDAISRDIEATATPTSEDPAKVDIKPVDIPTAQADDNSALPMIIGKKEAEQKGSSLNKKEEAESKKDEGNKMSEKEESSSPQQSKVVDKLSFVVATSTLAAVITNNLVPMKPQSEEASATENKAKVPKRKHDNENEKAIEIPATVKDEMDVDVAEPRVGPDESKIGVDTETTGTQESPEEKTKEVVAPTPPPIPRQKPVYVPEQWAVEIESDEEEEGDPFGAFKKDKPRNKNTTKNARKMEKVKINIAKTKASNTENDFLPSFNDDENAIRDAVNKLLLFADQTFFDEEEIDTLVEEGCEDSLNFFQKPHEDQDEGMEKFQDEKKVQGLKEQLKKIDSEDDLGKRQIDIVVQKAAKMRQSQAERNLQKHKDRLTMDERLGIQKLKQMHSERNNSNQSKIDHGQRVLRQRHAQETQKVLQQHRQQVQQQRLLEQVATNEWHRLTNRLRMKQHKQIQDFQSKGDEAKRRTEAEYKSDSDKFRASCEKRRNDLERTRKALYQRVVHHIQILRHKYIKYHKSQITQKKDRILDDLWEIEHKKDPADKGRKETKVMSSKDIVKEDIKKEDSKSPKPVESHAGMWYKDSPYEKAGAASRHKHRKGILGVIHKQLSVEFHNEGLWISQLLDKKSDDTDGHKNKKEDSQKEDAKHFVPWGLKARELLTSLISGEIPTGCCIDNFDFSDTVMFNGGHVRCVMTDLRTSDDCASFARASAVHEKEGAALTELHKIAKELTNFSSDAEKTLAKLEKQERDITPKVKDAIKDAQDRKFALQTFRQKFRNYLGAGKCLRTFGFL